MAQEAAHVAAGIKQPSAKELSKHAQVFGSDCVLESALHLPDDQYEALERTCARHRPRKVWNRRTKKYNYEVN